MPDGDPPQSGRIAAALRIRNVEILDTESGVFLPRRDLVLVGGRIAAQGDHGIESTANDVIDGTHLTAFPGFVDAHFHCSYSGHVGFGNLETGLAIDTRTVRAKANLITALDHGITSVLDVGSHGRIAVTLRNGVSAGSIVGPRMRVSGQIIVKAGGSFDRPQDTRPEDRLFRVVRDQHELELAIIDQAAWGVDAVKMQISASAVQSDDPPRASTFTAKELRSAVDRCHELGLLLCTHAEGDGPILEAVRAGVDVVQHGSFASRDALREIQATGTGLVFTPGVYRAIARNGPALGYPPEGLRRVDQHWGAMLKTIQDAAETGIRFGVGSDAGGAVHPHGDYLEDVVALVNDCRLPVSFALTAATRGAALAARMGEVGTMLPGAPADAVLANSELVHRDIKALRRSSSLTVIQGGHLRSVAGV